MKQISLLNAVWLMFLFLTITDFNWWFLGLTILLAPFWSEGYKAAKINQEANKRNKPIVERFENDLKNEK